VRSSDIAARCREIALRVECSGEWGELADTLRDAADEVERLRLTPSLQEEIVAWSVDLHDARQEIKRLKSEVERLRLTPEERELLQSLGYSAELPYLFRTKSAAMLKRLGGEE